MKFRAVLTTIIISLAASGAMARTDNAQGSKTKPATKTQIKEDLAKSRSELAKATDEYKQSLQKVIDLNERGLKDANDRLAKMQELFKQGLISKRELDEGQTKIAELQAGIAQTKKQMAEADDLLTESSVFDQLDKIAVVPKGKVLIPGVIATPAYIRYNGTAHWTLTDVAKVSNYFVSHFAKQLPISAYGQTATHDRLGFDHRNSVDVAVHPDSPEGQALIAYLQSAGIPFMAFRHAISGSATGAHIHIGYPSHRI
jgi:hypothetical protein